MATTDDGPNCAFVPASAVLCFHTTYEPSEDHDCEPCPNTSAHGSEMELRRRKVLLIGRETLVGAVGERRVLSTFVVVEKALSVTMTPSGLRCQWRSGGWEKRWIDNIIFTSIDHSRMIEVKISWTLRSKSDTI